MDAKQLSYLRIFICRISIILCLIVVVMVMAFHCYSNIFFSNGKTVTRDNRIERLESEKELEEKFLTYIKSMEQYNCRRSQWLGRYRSGGWNLCLDEPFLAKQNDSLFYSFGIGSDFTFDDAAANQFGGTVRSFDPTISLKRHRRASKRGEIQFYHVGLTGSTERNATTREMYPLPVLHEILDQQKVIDYLKFDIEGYEWGILQDLITSLPLRQRIKQIGFEIHTKHLVACRSTPGFKCVAEYERYTRILNDLEEVGFKRWHYDLDLNCNRIFKPTHCINVVYVNTKFNNSSNKIQQFQ